jgi:predicted nucleotidyltransferase component of viral defense system
LSYSEGVTGFTASLIEKDYYCSLILHHIFDRETSLVFKGGTCLSKVYADFDSFIIDESIELIILIAEAVSE